MRCAVAKARRCVAWIVMLVLMIGMLTACGSEEPETRDPKKNDTVTEAPKPTEEPGDVTPTAEPTPGDVTPTAEPTPAEATPTAEPTPAEATPTPEATPTEEPASTEAPTPTEVPVPSGYPTATPTPAGKFGTKMSDFYGTWYAKNVIGLESDLTECKDDPQSDYRLVFEDDEYDTARLIHAWQHNPNDESSLDSTYEFELRTKFSEEELKKYRDLNYGMEDLAKDVTDLSRGHLVYSCVDGPGEDDFGMLLIVDAQPDGSLAVEYAAVYAGGSFPVFTDYTFVRERVYDVGSYFEDYVGMWYAHENFNWGDGVTEVYPRNDGEWDFSEDYYRIYISPYGQLEMAFGKNPDDDKTTYILYWEMPEAWQKRFNNYPSFMDVRTNLNEKTLVFASLDGNVVVVAKMKDDKTLHITIDAGEYPYELTLTREHAYDYDCASIFMDYVGYYELSEYVSSDNTIVKVTDSSPYVKLRISRDGILSEMYTGAFVDYELRTKDSMKANPAWYAEHGLDKLYTDVEQQLWVFQSNSTTYMQDALIVVRMVADGELLISSYSNNNGNYAETRYAKYVRMSGER